MFAKVWHSVLFSVVQVERRWSEPVIPISFMVALQIFPKPGNGRKNKQECIFWMFWEMALVIPPRMLAPIALNLRNTHNSVSWSSACTNDGDVLLQSCTRGPDIRSIRSFYYLVFFHFDVFAGNRQKRNWKIDTSMGPIGAQNLFSSLYKLG